MRHGSRGEVLFDKTLLLILNAYESFRIVNQNVADFIVHRFMPNFFKLNKHLLRSMIIAKKEDCSTA